MWFVAALNNLWHFLESTKNKGPLVAGEGDGNIGAHPSNIWVVCMVESTQMLLSMDHVPVHGSLINGQFKAGELPLTDQANTPTTVRLRAKRARKFTFQTVRLGAKRARKFTFQTLWFIWRYHYIIFGHRFIFHPQTWFWFTQKILENQNQRNLSKWFTTQSSGPGRRWPVYMLSAGCAGLIDLDRLLICWYQHGNDVPVYL